MKTQCRIVDQVINGLNSTRVEELCDAFTAGLGQVRAAICFVREQRVLEFRESAATNENLALALLSKVACQSQTEAIRRACENDHESRSDSELVERA
jgi:hypothetical protein